MVCVCVYTILFSMFFRFSRRRLESVCVCVCVCVCTQHSSWNCNRASAAIFDSSVFFPASLAVVYIFPIFALRLHPFPPFSVSPYIRMYVRPLSGPVGACVRLCLRVLLPADAPSATRVRPSNFSSVNEIRWMRFGISVIVSLWVVVYAPTGPGASFSETPFSRPWTRTFVCVCHQFAVLFEWKEMEENMDGEKKKI